MIRTRGRGPWAGGTVAPSSRQLARPDVGVPPLVRRDPAEGFRPGLVLLDLGERVVEDDRVTFELEILEAGREVDGRHAAHRTRVRVLAAYVAPVSHDAGPPPRLAVHEACRHQVSLGGRCDRGDAPDRGTPGPGRADHDRARRGRGAAAQDRGPSAPGRLLRACDAGGAAGPGWQRPARDEMGGGVPGESGGRAARDPCGRGAQRSGDRRPASHPGRRPDHRAADGGGVGRGAVALRPAAARPGAFAAGGDHRGRRAGLQPPRSARAMSCRGSSLPSTTATRTAPRPSPRPPARRPGSRPRTRSARRATRSPTPTS